MTEDAKTYSASLILRISNVPSSLRNMPTTRTAGNTHTYAIKDDTDE